MAIECDGHFPSINDIHDVVYIMSICQSISKSIVIIIATFNALSLLLILNSIANVIVKWHCPYHYQYLSLHVAW